jgi:hypothetical protein
MSFKWIFENAETIGIETKRVVASTQSRDGTYRAVSRGGQYWRFEVKMPEGMRWSQWRGYIAKMEELDRLTAERIYMDIVGQRYFWGYQGNSVNSTGFRASIVNGSKNITLIQSPNTFSGFKFKAGDLIQFAPDGKVYKVAADVAFNSNTVTLHRPVLETTQADVILRVGLNVDFNLICKDFPSWTIFSRDQISWSGPFVFVEVI